jgi:hypothetical protein
LKAREDWFPPEFVQTFGNRCWEFIRPELLIVSDMIYDRYGKFFVNNYAKGGQLKYCGFRPFAYNDGAVYSKHKYGMAADIHPIDVSLQILYSEIITKINEFPNITEIEDKDSTPTWMHIACSNCNFKIVMGIK